MTAFRREDSFYRWRRMSDAQRTDILRERVRNHRPWHSPPHYDADSGIYLVTAACFEHRPLIGSSPQRLSQFSSQLQEVSRKANRTLFAWSVLPNHYHLLIRTARVRHFVSDLGRLHGRTSRAWNLEDVRVGRKVWFNAMETAIKSERHFWASLIYVFHNAVKHGYVDRWQDWPFTNATEWLASVGREHAVQIWAEFPIDDFGRDWDPPDF